MKRLAYIIFLLFLLAIPAAFAKQGHMRLLAVKEAPGGFNGSIADLYLEITDGTGRVFLDTFPLTKVDTQLSTRFAKEIACDYLDEDCSKFDFFYMIRSESPIVGGPSAGAAITFLTMALLDDIPIDESATVTGTINSGGIIGHVGGIKPKIDVAAESGLKKVLIPKGSVVKEANETVDLEKYAKSKNIEVFEASTVDDMIHLFTGREIKEEGNLSIDENYAQTMKALSIKLCGKSTELKSEIIKFDPENKTNLTKANEFYNLGMEAFSKGLHYTSASYCYGANVRYRHALYNQENLTESAIHQIINFAQRDAANLRNKLQGSEIETITDLETYMVVNDRLIEAEKYIEKTLENINVSERAYYLAYAMERIYSAYSWFEFLAHAGKKLNLNEETLKVSCQNKISEADERYQYVSMFISKTPLESTRDAIELAYKDLYAGDYPLCLFKASKAKAEADVILSVSNIEEEHTDILLQQKLDVAKKNIVRELNEDIFPVLGYSYYEYANSLKEDDKYSALLYAEYALELSGLDIYFKETKREFKLPEVQIHIILMFVWGFLLGLIVGLLIKIRRAHTKGKRRKHR
ncbi:hypothetical protein KY360_05870 [Candidatus Woesearchaeota archaeon]|nr:hypothetical protein [Candidatus Woesearchaeota archaeon]